MVLRYCYIFIFINIFTLIDLVGGVADIAETAVTSVVHAAGNVLGGAAKGIGSVVSQAVGLIADL